MDKTKKEMTPFWTSLIVRFVLNRKYKGRVKAKIYSKYDVARGMYEFRLIVRDAIRDFFLISLGIVSAGFGLKGFLLPNNFIDGGATGISLLISALYNVPLSYLIILVNFPFIVFG